MLLTLLLGRFFPYFSGNREVIEIIGTLECLEACRCLNLLDKEIRFFRTGEAGDATDHACNRRKRCRITRREGRFACIGEIAWNFLIAIPGGRIVKHDMRKDIRAVEQHTDNRALRSHKGRPPRPCIGARFWKT